jgi:hypothetical protein
MKKLYTLAACLLFAASSYGQSGLKLIHSYIPDTLKVQNPTVGTIVQWGFINESPTTAIANTDTLFLRLLSVTSGGNPITFKLLLPAAGIAPLDTVYFTDTFSLATGPANGTTFQWCDTAWGKHQGGGAYTESVTPSNNKLCKSMYVKNTTTSISDLVSTGRVKTMENLVVYPNPANNKISFKYDLKGQEGTISIHDLVGRLVYQEKLSKSSGQRELSVNVQDLAPGMYMVEVSTEESRSVGRLLINK